MSQSPEMRAAQQVAVRKGVMAAISLAVLSVIEYIIWASFEKPVLILAFTLQIGIYARNLVLIKKDKNKTAAPAT